jgi:hypothetical protein
MYIDVMLPALKADANTFFFFYVYATLAEVATAKFPKKKKITVQLIRLAPLRTLHQYCCLCFGKISPA